MEQKKPRRLIRAEMIKKMKELKIDESFVVDHETMSAAYVRVTASTVRKLTSIKLCVDKETASSVRVYRFE